jgi:peptidyl-prolyl cis-trans isomerase A (cyclophilin A)
MHRSTILDDHPTEVHTNAKGTLAFATCGPDSRTTQLFINLVDNGFLDDSGFTPFAEVLGDGMADVVEKLESSYGEGAPSGNGPDQSKIQAEGNTYLNAQFPLLSTLNSVTLVT